jgi:hypothetical protein
MTTIDRPDYTALGEQIAEEVAHLDAAHHRLLTNLRLFDEHGPWHTQGFRSCASWLSWRVGWTLGTAREHVRVANALGSLPAIDGALGRGELSYSKVRALTRVATPENEAVLLEQARLITGHQLETLCRKYASAQRHDEDASPHDDVERRYVSRRDREDGMVEIIAVLHPEEGNMYWEMLNSVASERVRAAQPALVVEDPRKSVDGSVVGSAAGDENADCSADITAADQSVAGLVNVPAADGAVARAPSSPPATKVAAKRAHPAFDRADALMQIVQDVMRGNRPDRTPTESIVSVPLETLQNPHRADPLNVGYCADGTPLSAHALRRLACDAGIVTMIEDAHGNPLAVGRKQRTISGSAKRAMLHRDKTCRFPGCNSTINLEGHHGTPWAEGGKTDLPNMCAVCGYHHRFVHEYGYRLELHADNTVTAYDPNGRVVAETPPMPQPPDLGWPNIRSRNSALGITPETIECWDGTPVDYGELVDWVVRADDGGYSAH